MENRPLILSNGGLRLVLAPALGGAIEALTWKANDKELPILRRSPVPLDSVLDAASFPLVPFVNRIRGGRFEFRRREIQLSPNMRGDPSPLHGQGWTSEWNVASAGAAEAIIDFVHEPGEWPWRYQAQQQFRLAAGALHMRLSCTNLSDEPMPCGLGFHPYFPCGADTRISTQVDEVWTVDDNVLPVDRIPATGRYAIADHPVCGRELDNGYGGWSGRTLVTDLSRPFEVEMTSPNARFFQIYSPASGGFFVAEPVTHANAALNAPEEQWAPLGLRILEPGEEMAIDARIAVQPVPPALVDTPTGARI